MSDASSQIVQKLWSYCNVLRDDGLSYGDYIEQLTFLLFLKMSHERTQPPWNQPSIIPSGLDWPSLMKKDGDALEVQYCKILEQLGKSRGMLGLIFRKAQNRIQDPAKLRRLIADLIDREDWTSLEADVKGDAYEGLLEKNALDPKSGAGQYFTPRPLIQAIVQVVSPVPGETICDPACGTGGFLLAVHDYVAHTNPNLTKEQKKKLKLGTFHGVEIVDGVARLCAMNLLLHGVGPSDDEAEPSVETADSLQLDPGKRYDVVLTNPPFGKMSSVTVVTEDGEASRERLTITRDDFWAKTSNKALNFVQHVKTLLEINGRAAVVVPDNVLFEGGAGETVRRKLLDECDVHTLLRLPTGIFYAQGVKANVLFFERKPASATPSTKKLWIYDLRTNQHFKLKANPLARKDLDEFVECYRAGARQERTALWSESNPAGRWRAYDHSELVQRDGCSLDISWLNEESSTDRGSLTDPEIDVLVRRYVREMARYEEVATLIERRLRRALRADAVRSLLSSRAKHPDDLRGKLERKRGDARYSFAGLDRELNHIVTDLAGCRVMVYRAADIEKVERVIRDVFEIAPLPGAFERHDKASGYRATHALVQVRDEEERLSLRGALCEVQIASLPAHTFNELEHDIGYKDHDYPPTADERAALEEVRRLCWMLDRSVERLVIERTKALRMQTVPLENAEELRFALEQVMGRPVHGDFARLFQLLEAVLQPLTAAALSSLSSAVLEAGEHKAESLGIDDADDVVHFALGLFDDYPSEIAGVVRGQRGPATLLKKAILKAADERKILK